MTLRPRHFEVIVEHALVKPQRDDVRFLAGGRLDIVPGATHLFEEPGTLEEIARLARSWFVAHVDRGHPSAKIVEWSAFKKLAHALPGE